MVKIQVVGENCTVTLSEPDKDGDYGWAADCGATSEEVRPIDEALAHAEIHVGIQCERLAALCEQCRERPGAKAVDPYQLELQGISVEMTLCPRCLQDRTGDI